MATEVNQTYFAWSQGETTELGVPQGVSVSQTLDHGSISFGRFELESLSWEKWSVFTNDRRHEEFGKFNGLVAQKKAYFEEYYKRIRELKAAQQQIQQTELTLEYSGDGSDSSQTGEDMMAAELETPTGSGTIVYDYMEQAKHETTSEQGMQFYHDHEDEDFHTEFSSSNIVSSDGTLQQTDQGTREDAQGDNSDSANIGNISSDHDSIGAAYENARAPKRITEKKPRLRYASKIIPKSIKTVSGSPLDHASVTKRPSLVKLTMSMDHKTKIDNVSSPNVASPKIAGTARHRKLTAKEALGVTGVRRPSSAAGLRSSTGQLHPIIRAIVRQPADVITPRRPSTAERRPVTGVHAHKPANVTTPSRPSTSERHPVKRENAAKHADIAPTCRPSTGERRSITRDSVLKMDPRTPSKTRTIVAHPKASTTTVSTLKKAAPPSATKSTNLEPKSDIRGSKGPSTFNSHLTKPKRMDLQVAGKHKSSSVDLRPRTKLSSSVGEPAIETFGRLKKKEGIQATVQPRASASKKTAPSQNGNAKARVTNPPPPPPPPRRPSRTMNKQNGSISSIGGRKAKASAPQWH